MNRLFPVFFVLFFAVEIQIVSAQTGWQVLNSGTANNLNAVFFLNADTGFVAGAAGTVLKTGNGGTNWTDISPVSAPDLNGIYFFNADTGLVVGSNGTILRTTDGGTNWTTVSSGIGDAIMTVDFSGNHGICGALSQGILYSHDAGRSWQIVQSGMMGGGFRGSVMLSPDIGFLGGENSIFQPMMAKTSNGGLNWNFFIFYLNNNEGRINGLEFIDVNTGYAASRVWDGRGAISKTADGGATWSTVFSSAPLNAIDFPVSEATLVGYAVGNNGIVMKTEVAGGNWLYLNSGTSVNLTDVYFINSDIGYVVGQNGTILKTTSGGLPPNSIGKENTHTLPRVLRLFQNYPNPFNPETHLRFRIADFPGGTGRFVTLKVYDILGKEVAVLVNENLIPGIYEVKWTARDYPGGVYFYRLTVKSHDELEGSFTAVRKMLLVR